MAHTDKMEKHRNPRSGINRIHTRMHRRRSALFVKLGLYELLPKQEPMQIKMAGIGRCKFCGTPFWWCQC